MVLRQGLCKLWMAEHPGDTKPKEKNKLVKNSSKELSDLWAAGQSIKHPSPSIVLSDHVPLECPGLLPLPVQLEEGRRVEGEAQPQIGAGAAEVAPRDGGGGGVFTAAGVEAADHDGGGTERQNLE